MPINALDFSHEKDLDIDKLARRIEVYFPDADFQYLKKAYAFAEKAHEGQMRSSGEDYIIHPLNVANILCKMRMDLNSIIAGLLHDVVEDCNVSIDEIKESFSEDVADLVAGLTKISKIKFKTIEESQAENFRKMVVAMAKDLRVIIIKLADRMHNMRTLQYVSERKQCKVAQETLDIYVPLASRLGINSVKSELEDLCLRYLSPDTYYKLAEKIDMKKSDRDSYIKETVSEIEELLDEYDLKGEVHGRSKHFYSIYKKMENRGVDFEQVQDVLAFRIMLGNITECYKALGIIHSAYKPIPGRFKDYIAIPKVNNYQSLHSTVIGPKAERIEIQIRTYEMNEVAETGVAAHWQYKESASGQFQAKKLKWVQDLLEFNQSVENNAEFMDAVKGDLDAGGIFVFTPTGDVKELRYGASPLDFAYAIHTEVGNRCVGAKVSGKMVPLRYRLKSGDAVEILTSKTQTPSKDWLKIAKTSRARTKIKQWLLKIERDKNQEAGQEIFDKFLKSVNHTTKSFRKWGGFSRLMDNLRLSSEEELYIHIGSGKYKIKDISAEFKEFKDIVDTDEISKIDKYTERLVDRAKKTSNKDNAVLVDGSADLLVRMGKCCNPIPGDFIVGFITRGRGITIHKRDCQRIAVEEPNRKISVEWNPEYSFTHPVSIRVITHDKPGILSEISKLINNLGINIKSAIAKSLTDQKGSFIFEVEVHDYSELLKTIHAVESKELVISVNRV